MKISRITGFIKKLPVIKQVIALHCYTTSAIKVFFNQHTTNAVSSVQRRNAFAPLVVFVCIVTPMLIGAIYWSEGAIKTIFVIVLMLLILGTLAIYIYLLLKKPQLLQSENFRIEDKKLDIIMQKGADYIEIEPVNLSPRQLKENDAN